MENPYANLLSPIQIRGVLLKNRMIATAGIPHMLQGIEDYPTEKVITHVANRARNGAAAVHLNFFSNPNGGTSPYDNMKMEDLYDTNMRFMGHDLTDRINMSHLSCHNYLCQCIDQIRYYGSIASTTPMGSYRGEHGGPAGPGGPGKPGDSDDPMRMGSPDTKIDDHGNMAPRGPDSSDPEEFLEQERTFHFASLKNITRAQMQEYIDSTVKNGLILKQFGFEMFTFHNAYHNSLPSLFFATDTNDRTDEYGGDAVNRARFWRDLYGACREAFGRDFPMEVLISAQGPGVSIPDSVQLCRQLEGIVDVVHLRAGLKDPQHPLGYNSARSEPSPNAQAAIAVKQGIRSYGGQMLVACSAGLQNPKYNEWLIREHGIDIIAMSRAWICDSEYGKKIYENRADDINPCIRCNKCHVPNDSDKFRAMCSINPQISREDKIDRINEKPGPSMRVAVVGGGPAGMKAAITAAQRGHSVTLYEKKDCLGGQLFHADYPKFKWPLADFKNWLISQTGKNGVDVRINTAATPEMLKQQGFDIVIVAIGPTFERPPIQGAENCRLAIDVYGHEAEIAKKVVIVGGSETAAETGMYLADCGHTVTMMTRQGMLCADAPHAHFVVMQRDYYLAQPNFSRIRYVKKYLAVEAGGVRYIDEHGIEQFAAGDEVIVAGEARAQPGVIKHFYNPGWRTYFIGDCHRAGDLHKAIVDGWATAMQF